MNYVVYDKMIDAMELTNRSGQGRQDVCGGTMVLNTKVEVGLIKKAFYHYLWTHTVIFFST